MLNISRRVVLASVLTSFAAGAMWLTSDSTAAGGADAFKPVLSVCDDCPYCAERAEERLKSEFSRVNEPTIIVWGYQAGESDNYAASGSHIQSSTPQQSRLGQSSSSRSSGVSRRYDDTDYDDDSGMNTDASDSTRSRSQTGQSSRYRSNWDTDSPSQSDWSARSRTRSNWNPDTDAGSRYGTNYNRSGQYYRGTDTQREDQERRMPPDRFDTGRIDDYRGARYNTNQYDADRYDSTRPSASQSQSDYYGADRYDSYRGGTDRYNTDRYDANRYRARQDTMSPYNQYDPDVDWYERRDYDRSTDSRNWDADRTDADRTDADRYDSYRTSRPNRSDRDWDSSMYSDPVPRYQDNYYSRESEPGAARYGARFDYRDTRMDDYDTDADRYDSYRTSRPNRSDRDWDSSMYSDRIPRYQDNYYSRESESGAARYGANFDYRDDRMDASSNRWDTDARYDRDWNTDRYDSDRIYNTDRYDSTRDRYNYNTDRTTGSRYYSPSGSPYRSGTANSQDRDFSDRSEEYREDRYDADFMND